MSTRRFRTSAPPCSSRVSSEPQAFQNVTRGEVLRYRARVQLRQLRRCEDLIDERAQRFPRVAFVASSRDQTISKLRMVPRAIVDAHRDPADVRARLPLANEPFEASDHARGKAGWTRANLPLEFLDRDAWNILELPQIRLLEDAPKIPGAAVIDRDQIESCG